MSGRTLWHLPPRGKHLKKRRGKTSGPEILNNSLPAVFNRAGYETFRTCKNGNSYSLANALFQIVKDKTARKAGEEDGSQWHGRQVLDYLNARATQKEDNKPFLIYFGFSHPHDERWGRDDLNEKYGVRSGCASYHRERAGPQGAGQLVAEHPFHHGRRFAGRSPGAGDDLTDRGYGRQRTWQGYACIENIDDQVGLVLGKLEQMGELENTLVIYTADHGIAVGRHGLMGKQNLYEHSWRVPFLASGPGIEPGSRAPGTATCSASCPPFANLPECPSRTPLRARASSPYSWARPARFVK